MKTLAAAFAVLLTAAPAFAAAPGRYVVDPARSKVSFRIRNFGVMTVKGAFGEFSGTIDLAEPFEKTAVEGTVKIASVDTGIHKRDAHLRTADFFDAAKFPEMTFKSTRASGTADSFELEGVLTIKGIPISVRFRGMRSAAGAPAEPLAVTAEAVVDRRDFGITNGSTIGNEATILLDVVAKKAP
ncbi:MAG: YceI family protein [Elusimicrobiota bacterium]